MITKNFRYLGTEPYKAILGAGFPLYSLYRWVPEKLGDISAIQGNMLHVFASLLNQLCIQFNIRGDDHQFSSSLYTPR